MVKCKTVGPRFSLGSKLQAGEAGPHDAERISGEPAMQLTAPLSMGRWWDADGYVF